MKLRTHKSIAYAAVALILAILLCSNQPLTCVSAQGSPDPISKGINGLLGAAGAVINGAVNIATGGAIGSSGSNSNSNNDGSSSPIGSAVSAVANLATGGVIGGGSLAHPDAPQNTIKDVGSPGNAPASPSPEGKSSPTAPTSEPSSIPDALGGIMVSTVNTGTKMVKDTASTITDKINNIEEKIEKKVEETILKPMAEASGSGFTKVEGRLGPHAQAIANMSDEQREKYLVEVRRLQEKEIPRAANLKQVVSEAKANKVIPAVDTRSSLVGNHAHESGIAVEVLDKIHEQSKIPVEKILRPVDKILGYEKNPIVKLYDSSYDFVRKPINLLTKPIDSVLEGAFETSDESKREADRYLESMSEIERQEARKIAEKNKNRSIIGQIADKSFELVEKPIEIALRPIDHLLGVDKKGQKNYVLKTIDRVYDVAKHPLDWVAKPVENLLMKMGEDDAYQTLLHNDREDPKTFTRLASGALNVADNVIAIPLELITKPIDILIGYDEPGKKNPIMDAAHQLKNATRLGVELWTQPIDRFIKEVSDLGDPKTAAARENHSIEQASRLVKLMDKMHRTVQTPFEFILNPLGKVFGNTKPDQRGTLLRFWDVIHQMARTPVQIVTKPLEDVIFGGTKAGQKSNNEAQRKAQIETKGGDSSSGRLRPTAFQEEYKGNIFIDRVKNFERNAMKPIVVITSPIRKLIINEDPAKRGIAKIETDADTELGKGAPSGPRNVIGDAENDRIMATVKRLNNVLLKPAEVLTQPISDLLSVVSWFKKTTPAPPAPAGSQQAPKTAQAFSSRSPSILSAVSSVASPIISLVASGAASKASPAPSSSQPSILSAVSSAVSSVANPLASLVAPGATSKASSPSSTPTSPPSILSAVSSAVSSAAAPLASMVASVASPQHSSTLPPMQAGQSVSNPVPSSSTAVSVASSTGTSNGTSAATSAAAPGKTSGSPLASTEAVTNTVV